MTRSDKKKKNAKNELGIVMYIIIVMQYSSLYRSCNSYSKLKFHYQRNVPQNWQDAHIILA